MTTHPYPHFLAALLALGRTNEERAERLGVCVENISGYRSGRRMPHVSTLARAPELIAALYRDVAQSRTPD